MEFYRFLGIRFLSKTNVTPLLLRLVSANTRQINANDIVLPLRIFAFFADFYFRLSLE